MSNASRNERASFPLQLLVNSKQLPQRKNSLENFWDCACIYRRCVCTHARTPPSYRGGEGRASAPLSLALEEHQTCYVTSQETTADSAQKSYHTALTCLYFFESGSLLYVCMYVCQLLTR